MREKGLNYEEEINPNPIGKKKIEKEDYMKLPIVKKRRNQPKVFKILSKDVKKIEDMFFIDGTEISGEEDYTYETAESTDGGSRTEETSSENDDSSSEQNNNK